MGELFKKSIDLNITVSKNVFPIVLEIQVFLIGVKDEIAINETF